MSDHNRYIEAVCCKCGAVYVTTARAKLGLCPACYYRHWLDNRNLLARLRRRAKEKNARIYGILV